MRKVVPLLVCALVGLLILTGVGAAQSGGFEPNDSPSQAAEGVAGNYTAVNIGGTEDDYYSVQLDEGDTLTVAIGHDHATANLDLAVRGPGGDTVASSDSTTDDESATVTAEESGTYNVRVHNTDDTATDYNLSLQRDDAVAIVTYGLESGETSRRFVERSDDEFDFASSSLPEDTPEANYTESTNRQRIENTGEYPWSAVGNLNSSFFSSLRASCTGTLIEDNHVLTAAHCVYNGTLDTWAGEFGSPVHFHPGRDGSAPGTTVNVTRVQTYAEYVQTDNRTYDMAVLTLNRSLSDEVGTFGFEHYDTGSGEYDAPLFGDSDTRLTGYPSARAGYVSEDFSQWDISIEGEGTNLWLFRDGIEVDLDEYPSQIVEPSYPDCIGTDGCHIIDSGGELGELTISGYSGGPVWQSTEDNRPEILSLQSAGPTGSGPTVWESVGVRITENKYSDIGAMVQYDTGDSGGTSPQPSGPSEPNDDMESASQVSPGSYEGLSIDSGESDYYAVDATAGDEVAANIDFSHAEGDLDLAVYSPSGDELDDSVSVSDGESVSVTADQSGTYYVEVYGYAGASGSYDLEISTQAGESDVGGGDQYEPNDNRESAAEISPGTYEDLYIDNGESDYFAVDATAGDDLAASIDFRDSEGDLDLAVYGPSDDELDDSVSVSDGESVSVTADQSGTYYVEVYGFAGASGGYDLEISTQAGESDVGGGDQYEPNDNRESAAEISPGTYEDLYIDNGESDYFAVDATAGDDLTASIDFSHAEGDLDLAVYGPSGDELDSSVSVSDDESLSVAASQTGTYYVEVYGFAGASGEYDLDVSVEAGESDDTSNDRFEPNNNRESAAEISTGTYEELYIDSGESDYFAVEATDGDEITANIEFSHAEGDLDLAVYGPDGDQLDYSVSVTDDESVTVAADQSGTYYVEAYGFAGASGEYDLGISTEAGGSDDASNDRFEPNDDRGAAAEISAGTHEDLYIDSGESDYFAVEATDGDELTASIEFSHAEGDLDLAVYGPGGQRLDSSASITDGESVTVAADQSGTYYVEVYGFAGASGEYDLDVSTEAGESDDTPNDRFESNDNRASATEISTGSYEDLYIDDGESDYFAVETTDGDALTASIDFSHAEGDLDLAVYGPDGQRLDSSASVDDDESVTVAADQSGTYYVEAYGFAGASGEYDLEISTEAGGGDNTTNDQFEPNDDRESATQVSTGTYEDLYIDDGESDYFAVEVAPGDELTANIDFSHAEGDLDLAVYGPSGQRLDSSASITDGESVSVTPDQSGTYYIEAYGFAGASGEYDLDVATGDRR